MKRHTIQRHRGGFTLIEVSVVLTIAGILLSMTLISFSSLSARTAARSAAMSFGRDLSQARAFALRSREGVTIRFEEDSILYRIESENGSLIASGIFGSGGEYSLDSLELDVLGDTIRFSKSGVIDMDALRLTLASALFSAGAFTYEVQFNATGSSNYAQKVN